MDLFVNQNKENNPVLAPTQLDQQQKEGLFYKNNNRYYPRKFSRNSCQLPTALVQSSSSHSLQREIERIAHHLH